jgi:hypothetical protein
MFANASEIATTTEAWHITNKKKWRFHFGGKQENARSLQHPGRALDPC